MDSRITATESSTNGTHRPDAPKRDKPKRQPTRKPKPAAPQSPLAATGRPVVWAWALFGVGFMSALSAALNGYANAQHAPAAWPCWLMGLAVPLIVLTLAKVAGEKWRTGQRGVGGLAGGSGRHSCS